MASVTCSQCPQQAFKDGFCIDCHRLNDSSKREGKEAKHNHLSAFGRARLGNEVDCKRINEEFLTSGQYSVSSEQLNEFKAKFMEMDEDGSGDIDIQELGRAMERIGKPKNQIQLRRMIEEVDTNNSGTICYVEFLDMMLGKKSSVLRLILMFEAKGKEPQRPSGRAPKRNLADLP